MEYWGGKNQHFRRLLFFAFHHAQKAAEAARDTCNVYGEGIIGERAAQKWFAKFKNSDFDLDDTPRSGRPAEFNEEHLKELLKEDGYKTNRELAEKMNCNHETILNHLHSMGFAEKLGAGVPHKFSEINKENPLQTAAQYFARHRATCSYKQRFLYLIVTGDEKWCLYINMKQSKEWVAPGDMPKPRVK